MSSKMKLTRNPIHMSPERDLVDTPNESSEDEVEKENVAEDDSPSSKTDSETKRELKESSNQEELQSTAKDQSKQSYNICNIISFSFAILSCFIWYLFYTNNNPINAETKNISVIIENLHQLHHNQPEWTFKILSAELEKVVVMDDPPSPAVLTILANPGAADTAKKFCAHLAEILEVENYILIDKSIYGQGNGSEIKIKIDEKIQTHVDDSSLNAVVVDHLEKIPLNATLIFHSYCDHENANFKRVVYMFILSLNNNLEPNLDPRALDSAAFRRYKETWSSAHPDDIGSLITRLTVAVINIQKENVDLK